MVQMVTNKFQGHAYAANENINFSNLSAFLYHLKKIFGPNKFLNQYRGKFGNLYMSNNKHIFSYIERIKELKSAIIDGESDLQGSQYLTSYDEERIERECLDAFVNGSPSDLLMRVKLEGKLYKLRNKTITRTIQLIRTLEAEARRKKPTSNSRY